MITNEPPQNIVRYRAVVADLHSGTYKDLGQIFDSREAATDALKNHFDRNPPQSVTDYDFGGYVEEVEMSLVYNPRRKTYVDEDGTETAVKP